MPLITGVSHLTIVKTLVTMKKKLVPAFIFLGMMAVRMNAQSLSEIPAGEQSTGHFDNTHVYFGLGLSAPIGAAFAGTVILTSGWGGSVTWNLSCPSAKNLPSDFERSSGGLSGLDVVGERKDKINSISFRVLKEFPTRSKKLRFGLEAGPSLVFTGVATNFVRVPDPCDPLFGCGANYTYETINSNSLGLSLKGKLEMAFTRPFGLEIGATSNINPKRSYFGADFLITLGYVRDSIER